MTPFQSVVPLVLSCTIHVLAQAPEIRSTAADRTELGITLYHAGYAMVRERRQVQLPAGRVRLALEDVAASIEPKTVQFRITAGAPVEVRERNYEYDLLSPDNLLKQSLGAKVWIPNPLVGAPPMEGVLASLPTPSIYAPPRTPLEAKLDPMPPMERIARIYRGRFAKRRLVEHDPGAIVRLLHGFVPVAPAELSFRSLPGQLRAKPTLLMDLDTPESGSRSLEVAYLAQALDWHATYTAALDSTLESMDLDAFITLTNKSGSSFPGAALQLLAGAPNRVPDPDPEAIDPDISRADATVMVVASASEDSFRNERIGDNQLFTLGRPTSLSVSQTKQISLFSAQRIKIEHRSIFGISIPEWVDREVAPGPQDQDAKSPISAWAPCAAARTRIRFVNRSSNRLGRPLPQGQLYVHYMDRHGTRIPLEEGVFEETPENEEAEFDLGPIAGLSGRWRIHDIKRGGWFRQNTRQATVEVRIANKRSRPESIELKTLVGADWELLSSSHLGNREGSEMMSFQLTALPGETWFSANFLIPDPIP